MRYKLKIMVGSERFELSTLCSGGIRSIQLSYEPDEEATRILTCPPGLRHKRRGSHRRKTLSIFRPRFDVVRQLFNLFGFLDQHQVQHFAGIRFVGLGFQLGDQVV